MPRGLSSSILFPYTTLFRSHTRTCVESTAETPSFGAYCEKPVSNTDRKSTRLNSSHQINSYAVFCVKKKKPGRERRTAAQGQTPRGILKAHEESQLIRQAAA